MPRKKAASRKSSTRKRRPAAAAPKPKRTPKPKPGPSTPTNTEVELTNLKAQFRELSDRTTGSLHQQADAAPGVEEYPQDLFHAGFLTDLAAALQPGAKP